MNTSSSFTNKVHVLSDGGHYRTRPVEANDRERIIELFNHLSPESRYLRFAHAISKLPDDFLEDILHLDYKKEMALLAIMTAHTGAEEIIGMARYVTPPNQNTCEFSLSVSDSHTTQGIGTHLMLDLIEHAKKNGLKEMIGYVLSKNSRMFHLVSDLGFQIHSQDDDPDFKTVSLPL
jgi:N-acetylglutamate synthase-like GNAT family acetyltransferase